MKKYICTRGWKRNPTGDVIDEWEYNKLPEDVKSRNFTEWIKEPVVTAPPEVNVPVIVTAPVEPVKPVEEHKPVASRFKPFKVEDVESKDED